MTIKTKAVIALSFGAICVVLGLIYGVSGQMQQSISARSENIARWEKELAKDGKEIEVALAKTDKLGNKTDATPEEREEFGREVAHIERMTRSLGHHRDLIEYERDRRKEQLLITAGLATLGALAMLVGVLLLRRRRVV